jgi:hypothetical protein
MKVQTSTCTYCKVEQDVSLFSFDKQKRNGLTSWCRTCRLEGSRRWKAANPDVVRNSRLKHKFGITLDRYTEIFNAQGGVCAICRQVEKVVVRSDGYIRRELAVDHDRSCCPTDRSCGECVRGLLCQSCNTGIGKLGDSVERLEAAIGYINKSNILKGDK